jgi:hypothetical protein
MQEMQAPDTTGRMVLQTEVPNEADAVILDMVMHTCAAALRESFANETYDLYLNHCTNSFIRGQDDLFIVHGITLSFLRELHKSWPAVYTSLMRRTVFYLFFDFFEQTPNIVYAFRMACQFIIAELQITQTVIRGTQRF